MISSDDNAEGFNVVLIDYGMATEYRNGAGEHLPMEEMEQFSGNLIFASEYTLNFMRPSRRDDMLSLCYVLIFLLNDMEFPMINEYFSDPAKVYQIDEVLKFKRTFHL